MLERNRPRRSDVPPSSSVCSTHANALTSSLASSTTRAVGLSCRGHRVIGSARGRPEMARRAADRHTCAPSCAGAGEPVLRGRSRFVRQANPPVRRLRKRRYHAPTENNHPGRNAKAPARAVGLGACRDTTRTHALRARSRSTSRLPMKPDPPTTVTRRSIRINYPKRARSATTGAFRGPRPQSMRSW